MCGLSPCKLAESRSCCKHVLHITVFTFSCLERWEACRGPRLGEQRAETLNHFMLIYFMILLGPVFIQIAQPSGLDNLLEINSV